MNVERIAELRRLGDLAKMAVTLDAGGFVNVLKDSADVEFAIASHNELPAILEEIEALQDSTQAVTAFDRRIALLSRERDEALAEREVLMLRSSGAMEIAEGNDGWEAVPVYCPMMEAVRTLRLSYDEALARVAGLESRVAHTKEILSSPNFDSSMRKTDKALAALAADPLTVGKAALEVSVAWLPLSLTSVFAPGYEEKALRLESAHRALAAALKGDRIDEHCDRK